MSKGNYEMKLPELDKFSSIAADVGDLKDKVNQLQSEKRVLRIHLNAKQEAINKKLLEIEKLEGKNNVRII